MISVFSLLETDACCGGMACERGSILLMETGGSTITRCRPGTAPGARAPEMKLLSSNVPSALMMPEAVTRGLSSDSNWIVPPVIGAPSRNTTLPRTG
jgi:hypothetical protein